MAALPLRVESPQPHPPYVMNRRLVGPQRYARIQTQDLIVRSLVTILTALPRLLSIPTSSLHVCYCRFLLSGTWRTDYK
jgi:hypothetical protein